MDPFAALADPLRRGVLVQLAEHGPTRVTELCERTGVSRPAVSRHLRVLRQAGLVDVATHGRERHYALRTDALTAAHGWISALLKSAPAAAVASSASTPPVDPSCLDALDLEVRRTVREGASTRHTPPARQSPTTEEIA